MLDMFFSGGAAWFSVLAITGTSVFVLRLVLLFVGHHVGDLSVDSVDAHHGDPGEAFKALSIQSFAAFFMGFGWAGLGALKGSGMGTGPTLLIAGVGGLAMVWLLAILLKGLHDMQTGGTIPITDAVGNEGDVYLTVPASKAGQGQVRITIGTRQRIYNALTEGDAIPTNGRVRVVGVNDDNTVTVVALT